MPDDWEDEIGLNKFYPEDRNLKLGDGTTFLEVYLNSLAEPKTGVGIRELDVITEMKVFPNPATSKFTVQYSLEQNTEVEFKLIDMSGRVVIADERENQYSGFNSKTIYTSTKRNIFFKC
jgi:hypothetical protein